LQGTLAAGLGIDAQRAPGSPRQIFIERAGDAVLDHIDGPGDGVGRNWNAACHGFQVHQTESIRAAGENHDVRRRQVVGQIFPEAIAGKNGIRELLFEARPLRAVANDDLAARP